jgi:hypothetical protein
VKSNDALPFGYSAPEDLFIKLQRCSELLTDPTKLSYYSRFGDTNYSFKNESVMFPIMAVFSFIGYIVNFMICSVMTASNESKNGRYFIVCFLIFSFSSEMYMKFLGEIYLFTSGHNLLVYEQIDILKELIPSVLSGALLLSQLIYSNDRKMINQVLKATSESNVEIANFIVNSRKAGNTVAPTPAAIRLMQPGQARSVPTPLVPDNNKDAGISTKPWNIQRIMQILFWGYVLKMIYNMIRQSI